MKKIVCDICGKDADVMIKAKISRRLTALSKNNFFVGWDGNRWSIWKNIHICSECAEKIGGKSV